MKEIDVQDIIKNSGILEIISNKFASKLGVSEDKLKLYLKKKVENRLNDIGEQLSSGDMTPEDFNKARRLSDMDLSELNDEIIKDK
jgi:hypothetical protein